MTKEIEIDTRGLYCPEPIMMMHAAVRDAEPGNILKVLATDPATQRDVPKFCQFLEHELLSQTVNDEEYIYLIKLAT